MIKSIGSSAPGSGNQRTTVHGYNQPDRLVSCVPRRPGESVSPSELGAGLEASSRAGSLPRCTADATGRLILFDLRERNPMKAHRGQEKGVERPRSNRVSFSPLPVGVVEAAPFLFLSP